ncbi:MAG: hypothetical protein JSV88_20965 [Candidatus Aminicenantes bacterium]|nr:MAG: hypothetical protein JSV88_20965 [Candidatus Aminicenantes bacterium]
MKYIEIIFLMILFIININLFSQKEKKIELEFSFGVAGGNLESISQRSSGIDELLYQYARYYQADYSAVGKFPENKLFIPINFSINYRLNKEWYLQAGFDYSFSNGSSGKAYQVAWDNFYEQYDYDITDRVSYVMPHIGVRLRLGSFDFYSAVGMGFARFTHTEDLRYSESEPGYSYDTNQTFKVKGSAPAVIIGIKYRLNLFKKSSIQAFVKLETVLLKVNSLDGSKTTVASDPGGTRYSQVEEGTLYQFQWNPFEDQGFDSWDIYETLPDDPTKRNFQEMGINLSGIRLMIGISF